MNQVIGKQIFVTGASGFIGRSLCGRLCTPSLRVLGVDQESCLSALPEFLEWDLCSDNDLILPSGISTIIHLAGKAHALSEVRQDDAEYFRINTLGTRKILQAAQRAMVKNFVFISTVKAMGELPQGDSPCSEVNTIMPETPYGISKREAEEFVLNGGYVENPVVLRPCLVYGKQPKGNLDRMINAVVRNHFPPLKDCHNKRSMVHIDDLIEAVIAVAGNPVASGRTYIVADNSPFSTRELFDWIRDAAGMRQLNWSVPNCALTCIGRMGDLIGKVRGKRFVFDSDAKEKLLANAWYSSAKLQSELSWSPKHNLKDSLPDILRSMNLI